VTATFAELNLLPELLRAITEAGYVEPTPIQRQAIGPALAGRDIVGCAQTGTGKTAAFALPMLQRLDAPTGAAPRSRARWCWRRPASSRPRSARASRLRQAPGPARHTVIFGGVGQGAQVRAAGAGSTSWSPRRAACST
jgi:ATP-dependent RNA helicase RhlE